ncbi:M16 family metallopeptidase [Desulfosoma caldarium]|uniref:Putative Zn-dependent peptidase n=1 Tax=Desulfosoma caldarium TaxID=610254 RepID=A0A3N1UJC6_9BACT|nr:pitrilysin family protein [Desulfosoma caldarium]ROQ90203.1 putative Zn-dependent peptidase [Desulfosoma caldarium]
MVRKTVLSNGIRIVTEKMPGVHSVSMGIWVNVGSRDEEPHEQGVTHFIEHMLFKGTAQRSALDIAMALDAVGGFANAFTSKENLCLHAKVLDSHLDLVVDVLTDIFLHSLFADEDIEKERQVVVQEINMIEDSPEDLAHILFQQHFWRAHPLGAPIYGTQESVMALDRSKILNFLSRRFAPRAVLVAAAGNVDHEAFVDLVAPHVASLNHSRHAPHRQPPQVFCHRTLLPKDLEQVHICLGFPGCSQADPERFACHVVNVVLGNSMSSRLFQEVREKRGLAYSIYSFVNSHEDTGLMGVYAAVSPENVAETLDVITAEMDAVRRDAITASELDAAKEYLKGSMYLNAESTDARMNRLAKNEFVFGRHVPLEEVEKAIDAVTVDDVRAWFVKHYQPENTAVTLLGPVENTADDMAAA